jgi:ribosomal protein L22
VSPPERSGPKQPARPAAQGASPPEEGWESLKVDELKDELEARGLPKSGTKAELVARLEEADAEAGPAAPHAEAPPAEAPADEAAAEAPAPEEAADEGIAEEVVPPEEPAEEPSADEVEEAEGPDAEADEDEPEVEAASDEGEPEAEAEADEEEPEGEPADEEAVEGEAAPAPTTRRRGSAETSTGERRAAPRELDGEVVIRARSKYVRSAPRKARLVMDHIRGKEVVQARAILTHAPRAVADDILKLLNSAVANAESTYELDADELRVRKAFVDEGPTIKRFRPRALGRATRINKRTSHMTIELTTTDDGR